MFDIPELSIAVASPRSEDIRDLLRNSGAGDHGNSDELLAPNAELIVARVGGRAVGCIVLIDHVRFGEAKRLYVEPEHRGTGIGAALVAALESAARDIGLKVVTVDPEHSGHLTPDALSRLGFQTAKCRMEKQLCA